MSRLVLILLCAVVFINCAELPSSDGKESAREEKLRSALIDAFQNIKKASAKGGIDDESPLTADLIGSMINLPNRSRNDKPTTGDSFDVFADDDGLSFAEAFGDVETERKAPSTEASHNVQHIVKTTKLADKTTSKPNRDILSKLSDSIRSTLNESKLVLRKENLTSSSFHSNSSELGIENMLRIFDAEILVSQWRELQRNTAGECRADMQDYVDGLQERKLWALKSKCLTNILYYLAIGQFMLISKK